MYLWDHHASLPNNVQCFEKHFSIYFSSHFLVLSGKINLILHIPCWLNTESFILYAALVLTFSNILNFLFFIKFRNDSFFFHFEIVHKNISGIVYKHYLNEVYVIETKMALCYVCSVF